MSEPQKYAVIKTSGQQLRVSPGQKITVNRLAGEVGSEISFSEVLAVSNGDGTPAKIGTPLVGGASVTAKILSHSRGEKVLVFHKRRRKRYAKKQGHRQELTSIQIEAIAG